MNLIKKELDIFYKTFSAVIILHQAYFFFYNLNLFLEQGQSEEGKVERDQGYNVQPLKVEMTAHIKPALWVIF